MKQDSLQMQQLKLQFKSLIRHRLSLAFYICSASVIVGFIVFFSILQYDGFRILYIFFRYQIYFVAIVICISFEFFYKYKSQAMDELLSSYSQGRNGYRWYTLLCQLAAVTALHIIFIITIIAGSLYAGTHSYFYGFLWKPYFYHAFLPSVIGVLLSWNLSNICNRFSGYGCIVVFLIMISPLPENIILETEPVKFSIGWALPYLFWPFRLLYQNGEWSPDIQYGLQTEIPRLQLLLFWLVLLGGTVFGNGRRTERKIGNKLYRTACLLLAIVFLVLSMRPASIYRLDHSWNGYYKDFYQKSRGSQEPGDSKLAVSQVWQDKIVKYDMQVSLGRQLEVQASLQVHMDVPKDTFLFTLYQDYKIHDLSTKEPVHCTYTQQENIVTVSFDQEVTDIQLNIIYQGYHPVFYSNTEGAMLPGYFPWYPMAGEKPIFLYEQSYYGYNPHNRIEPADVHIHLKSGQNIITNLQRESQEEYNGTTDSISIFAGNLIPMDEGRIRDYLPFYLNKGESVTDYRTSAEQRFHEIDQILKQVYGIENSELDTLPVLITSKDLARNFSIGNIAVFDDYIITSDVGMNMTEVMKYYASEKNRNSALSELLITCCNFNTASETIQGMKAFLQENIRYEKEGIAQLQAEKDTENLRMAEERMNTNSFLYDQISLAVERVGEKEFLHQLFLYVTTSKLPTDDKQFLLTLGERE